MKSSIQRLSSHQNRLRTAAYCRVSTDLEEQEGSFETQVRYYREKIEQSPDMELVDIYGDKGRSGLKAGSRPELQ
ncbi:MAG: recombinase family protein, partial [Aristaeellaceae bacterium]